jgi:SEC-C motif-containing protein
MRTDGDEAGRRASTVVLLALLPLASGFHVVTRPARLPERVHPLMAQGRGRKPGSKSKPSGGGGGFGAAAKPNKGKPAPTLESVCAGFVSRLPDESLHADTPCPCGGPSYLSCCRPYHRGEALVDSPERTLRSRYSAFAYRLPAHIIATTHRTNADYRSDQVAWARQLNRESMFDSYSFERLEIGEIERPSEGGEEGPQFLSFTVELQPVDERGKSTRAPPLRFSERSRFLRDDTGAWLYAGGDVTAEGSDVVLNPKAKG